MPNISVDLEAKFLGCLSEKQFDKLENAILAGKKTVHFEDHEWQEILNKIAVYESEQKKWAMYVDRNNKGVAAEKEGDITKAIEYYEENLKDNFPGSHPYTRLAIIYKKLNKTEDEIRVLMQAIKVTSDNGKDYFHKRLEKARNKIK